MSSSNVRVSAVICTHNRRRYLEKAVDSLLHQSAAPAVYEILVVDNGSTDGTPAYLEEVAAATGRLTRLFEARLGLSRARNLGLERARGEFVAFLDDDAVARKDWIERIQCAFDGHGRSVGVLAGRTDPIWEAARPDWLSDRGLGALAIVDWGEDAGFLSEGQYMVGANMAFRTELLREVRGFPENLGRVGDNLLSGEEIFVARLLADRGYPTFYDPSVAVLHHVQRDRLARGWFLRRAYWEGLSRAIGRNSTGRVRLGIASAAILFRLPGGSMRALYFLLKGDPARCFDAQLDVARSLTELSAGLGTSLRSRRHDPV